MIEPFLFKVHEFTNDYFESLQTENYVTTELKYNYTFLIQSKQFPSNCKTYTM